jgi:hypothetical protein
MIGRDTLRRGTRLAASLGLAGLALGLTSGGAVAAGARHKLRMVTLSNRADLISGGQALVQVLLPHGIRASQVRITLNGHTITSAFAVRPDGRFEGLVKGLVLGRNALVAREANGRGARLTITDHPIGGPVFSGPQLEPWICEPGAIDAKCDKPTTYSYEYMSSSPNGGFHRYDASNPPSDVATTTTQSGKKVPFIVRVETGYEDRDQYQIAVLYDPKKPWTPWAPQPQWNGKVEVPQGASCGSHHGTETGANVAGAGPETIYSDSTPSVMDSQALGLGFAVMATALDNAGHNCNIAVQAESVMMLKEHFIDIYGPIRYTIANGCSGGSLSQLQDANAYPGLYQGLVPSCTFYDAWSSAMDAEDCPLLERYFENPSGWAPGVTWNDMQEGAADGKTSPSICHAWTEVFPFYQDFIPGVPNAQQNDAGIFNFQNCGLPAAQVFDPSSNPNGTRCDLQDYFVDIFGRRPDGYANRPLDNVGVQYGLRALMSGAITPAQFVDLNYKIGSHNINYVWQQKRVAADLPALAAAYRSGAVNEANNLNQVAIIDEPSGNTDIHEEYHAFALSARMDKAYGNHANHVIWYGLEPSFPNQFLTMDRWLSAVAKDTSHRPLAKKIVVDKPANIKDICNIDGHNDFVNQGTCQRLAAPGTGTRTAAGAPFANDILKCQLKPLRASDYYPVQFTTTEWAELKKTFPTGVCDWSKRGVGQQPTIPWQTYTHGPGGRPLGPPPQSIPLTSKPHRRSS